MPRCRASARRLYLPALFIACAAMLTGCGGPQMAPVRGRVLYHGTPLEFGGVMFQPEFGHPAVGAIGPDGYFDLETPGLGAGAAVGKHQVRVTCFEGQRPQTGAAAAVEMALGRSLIPQRYNHFDSSGLVVEVALGQSEPVILRLTDDPPP